MSRWLSQVNNFLEQLDDQAETYVEETITSNEDQSGEQDDNLDSILASRGLASEAEEEEDVAVDDKDAAIAVSQDDAPKTETLDSTAGTSEGFDSWPEPETRTTDTATTEQPAMNKSGQPSAEGSDKKETGSEALLISGAKSASKPEANIGPEEQVVKPTESDIADGKTEPPTKENQNAPEKEVKGDKPAAAKPELPTPPPAVNSQSSEAAQKTAAKKAPPPPPPPPPAKPTQAAKKPPSPVVDLNPALVKEAREAQKEVRTLRRHVVTLNKQLESVEAEVAAQRKELEQAATQMEKDRAKAKTERDNERKRHAEELNSMQAQHEATLMDQKARMEKQFSEMSRRLQDIEHTRMQEGGNWDQELQAAVEREQMLGMRNASLEDEKATMLAQIHTLQSQQETLGERIESLSQTADSAMEREREAEERLDQALSVHAHQISQRQARESELERTIAEMGAAMASARNKESSRLQDYRKSTSEASDTAGENTSQDSGLRVRLDMALHDLDTAQANLDLERQRNEALQRELRDITKERTEDATNARMQQNKCDRQIAELTLQVSRLQQCNDAGKEGGPNEGRDSLRDETEVSILKNQVKELSEEILKSRESLSSYSSQMSTMKSRLKSAIDRAEKAEVAMEEALAVQKSDSYDRMERGSPASGNSMRRRGVGRSGSGTTAISNALHLEGGGKKAIDALDSFSVSTGKYLRSNPFARAAFIAYLMLLHLWTFVVIFFHAHNFEDYHRDGADMPHGPDSLMQNQLGAGGQAVAAAVSAAKEKQP